MVEWPGRCRSCGKEIESWMDAGLHDGRWIHKLCFAAVEQEARAQNAAVPELRSPVERSRTLELPMIAFLLLFHFGLGAAVMGWITLEQDRSVSAGVSLLIIGLVAPVVGLAGVAVNIVSRRRIELIRQEIDREGGWSAAR